MVTYQDFLKIKETGNEEKIQQYLLTIINTYKTSDAYKTACTAYDYMRGQNVTIKERIHKLITKTGQEKVDIWSPNNKTATSIFKRFIYMECQYLLSNGIRWEKEETVNKLGKMFDNTVRQTAKLALSEGVAFLALRNNRKGEFDPMAMSLRNFAPLYDEQNGALRAGIYFYQIDDLHPTTIILFEEDGYTGYLQNIDSTIAQLEAKQTYIRNMTVDGISGERIYDGENYPTFPVIPYYGNSLHQSELIPLRDKIDAYDRIQNDYIDRLEDTQFYWIIRNAGGMDDNEEIARFLDQLKAMRAASLSDGSEFSPVEVHVPYQESETILSRLERALYKDAMMTDVENIAGGAVTATQIEAAYTPLKIKASELEECTLNFLNAVCEALGIDDSPVLTPDVLLNKSEEISNVNNSYGAGTISREYATERILTINGDIDKLDEVLMQMDATDMQRISGIGITDTEEQQEEANDEINNTDRP